MTVLLDTSIMIDSLRHRHGRREWLLGLVGSGHDLACCAVNVVELYSGMRPDEADETAAFVDNLVYVQISRTAARYASEMRERLLRRGKTVSLPDALIAAVAIESDLALATGNVKHFSFLGVKLISPPED